MNRTISDIIKSPTTWLFCTSFITAIVAFTVKEAIYYPLKSTCVSPVSYYAIENDDHWTRARGVFRTYRESLTEGRIVYIGTITYHNADAPTAHSVHVLREVRFKGTFKNNILRATITGTNRRLGDQSNKEEVAKYIFPHIKTGASYSNMLFLINGVTVATGEESTPSSLCIN